MRANLSAVVVAGKATASRVHIARLRPTAIVFAKRLERGGIRQILWPRGRPLVADEIHSRQERQGYAVNAGIHSPGLFKVHATEARQKINAVGCATQLDHAIIGN